MISSTHPIARVIPLVLMYPLYMKGCILYSLTNLAHLFSVAEEQRDLVYKSDDIHYPYVGC